MVTLVMKMLTERKWEKSFAKTQMKLSAAAKHARKEIAEGKAQPMDFKKRYTNGSRNWA
jgi:hypothetical protein